MTSPTEYEFDVLLREVVLVSSFFLIILGISVALGLRWRVRGPSAEEEEGVKPNSLPFAAFVVTLTMAIAIVSALPITLFTLHEVRGQAGRIGVSLCVIPRAFPFNFTGAHPWLGLAEPPTLHRVAVAVTHCWCQAVRGRPRALCVSVPRGGWLLRPAQPAVACHRRGH